ncbi:glutaredoxin family protein [Metabacillus fastidiosus]|uniref:glutaredoxin family protein n=1 Tax=Metabacillus fastidiosus TaxID=1458 RepID=UPI002DC004FD|nr:glutaredoxin domain-containing protein [Metabacillus fastidiosus]MEC2074508.1 glutaredoxin domain-containing protein [Metabacillus fastidiosus]
MKKFQLELYTRPTCSDCQEGKKFLHKNGISYIDYDLTKHPSKEDELIKITGTRIVPAFVFKNKSLLGWMSKPKVLIGFERNIDEIREILNRDS